MKLSDVKGERTLDVIADLIEPITNIAQDKDAAAVFKPQAVPDGMDSKAFFTSRIREHMPALLKAHKDDVVKILATIEGVDAGAYAESLNLVKIIKDFTELITDEAFIGFLSSSASEMAGDAATVRSEITEGR